MRDTIIRGLIGAESALSSATYRLWVRGYSISIADVQDINEHIDEIQDLLRALHQVINGVENASNR
ncbi:hypothetical protein QN239_07165 [Mycolicibacterium sp. Y3]